MGLDRPLVDPQKLRVAFADRQVVPALTTVPEQVLLSDNLMPIAHKKRVSFITHRDSAIDDHPQAIRLVTPMADEVALDESIGTRIQGLKIVHLVDQSASNKRFFEPFGKALTFV